VRDENLACELWVQKGTEPWLLRYRPKLAEVDEMSLKFFAGDLWLEVESCSRELPKDAFALVASKGSRLVDDLAEGVMEEQQRYAEMAEALAEQGGEAVELADIGDEPAPQQPDERPHPSVDKPAPDVQWTLLDGTAQRLTDLKGKVVVIDFWATWCTPCVMALPKITAVAKRYADQGVVFVGCDLEESKAGVEKFLARKNLEFACAIVNQDFAKLFGVSGIPHTVMVDRDGVIRKVHIGYAPGQEKNFEADLRELLGLPREAKADPEEDTPKPAGSDGQE
jgi:thiol-disulfide isomerase/thioredoxin